MKGLCRLILGALAACAVGSACNGNVSPDPDSETNWLRKCGVDSDCAGEARCLCGLCTKPCDGNSACATGPTGSTCVSSSAVEECKPSGQTTLCLVQCAEGGECTGGQACQDGLCVAPDASPSPSKNPTGSCVAPNNGARRGYHSPDSGEMWLPDCNNVLRREYYRVFLQPSGKAYVMPEWSPLFPSLCLPTDPAFSIMNQYGLCEGNNPVPEAGMNDMDPADALALAHRLHELLVFELQTLSDSSNIAPHPIPEDILEACRLRPQESSQELLELCDREQERYDSGNDIGFTYEGYGAVQLAQRLNELYGIDATSPTLSPELCDLPPVEGVCKAAFERYAYNPVTAQCEPFAYGGCGGNANNFETEEDCRSGCYGRAQSCSHCTDGECTPAEDCRVCPLAAPNDGRACAVPGFSCAYWIQCGPQECACEEDDRGELVWACYVTLC